MACADQISRRIPDNLAILVNEFDQLLTSLAPVPLSNIDQAAAQLLERMMRGEPAPEAPVLIPPIGIVRRRSTQTTAIEDPLLGDVLQWMQDNAHRPIQIIDVQEQFHVSRRLLEHRFKQYLDTTPAHILRRMRLQSVRRYLTDTTLPLARIATLTGLNHVEVLVRTFRREMGMTPGEFRRQ